MTLKATPLVTFAGAETLKCVAGSALTVVFVLPVRPPSATLIDCDPSVVSVTLNVCAPLSPPTKV